MAKKQFATTLDENTIKLLKGVALSNDINVNDLIECLVFYVEDNRELGGWSEILSYNRLHSGIVE